MESLLPSQHLSQRVRELRKRHGWGQTELAERMSELGHVWIRSTVAKVELLQRQVTVDEMIGLAWVLGVAPPSLLVPLAHQTVRVSPNTVIADSSYMWNWMAGTFPMGGRRVDDVRKFGEDRFEVNFYYEAQPDVLATAEARLPGLRRVAQGLAGVQRLAGCQEDLIPRAWPGLVPLLDEVHRRVGELRRHVKHVVDATTKEVQP